MAADETLSFEVANGVGWVTINRPEVLNALDDRVLRELHGLWRSLRSNDDVRCVVLTGAGDRAFSVGIDRDVFLAGPQDVAGRDGKSVGWGTTPFHFDDPGAMLGPKAADLWTPVIAAVNGMACGGAFYLLGEADFIIAAEHATFFDPHVTYGLTAVYEPIHMLQKMPFHEIMRVSLLGNHERMSARRAFEIGLVSEVVPKEELLERARWAAEAIASQPPLAVQGTVRAIWTAREMARSQALSVASSIVALGNDPANRAAGQQAFESKQRTEWRLR